MESKMATILVVDDEPLQAKLHTVFLEDAGYQTLCAENGKQALDILEKDSAAVNVILSDVSMPEMDGYEFCRQVKDNEDLNRIPFIFVSALTDLDEKLKGYSVGGDDYVSKPISTEELLEKVKRAVTCHEEMTSQKQQLQESYNTAMQAMTYSSDLGQILEFHNGAQNVHSFDELSECLFQVMGSLGLRSTLYVVTPNARICIGDKGAVSPLEENVIEMARQKDRFWDFGTRTIINYKDFSLLIKNMPVDDPERFGMLKDTLGSLCNAIESRITILLFDETNKQKAQILESVRLTLGNTSETFRGVQKANLKSIQVMIDELDDTIMILGLTEEQEKLIRGIAVKCYDRMADIFGESMAINDDFEALDKRLTEIFSQ